MALSERVRAELAAAQLRRPGTTGAGWDHSAADLLPLLAARAFGIRINVVSGDGGFQDFAAPGAAGARPHLVLSLADRHYRLAVPDPAAPATVPEP